ncbi:hypothetical protein J2S13_000349 [Oikeobacillus pervagus]|uniref:Uncharacterized protein n=1 Tax=Oikeobacillus pervagus TaxID=1325931 RepID=A0AAJ1T0Y8_9BACI|nr:hypothetical protein [Oikeobacillus pervagus]MDQ0213954.1 hypothetical protein [Oikeobacillus pervagus]
MEMYKKAYERYKEKCKKYGIESIQFYHFIHHLTEQQMELMMDDQ